MKTITEWMVDEHIAANGFAAGHISEGLKLADCNRTEQEKRCHLYRKWRPKTDKTNEIPTWQAYQLAISGVDPVDVQPRQIDMFEKCEHETSIVLESFGAVDKLQCTWTCGKIYWTVREKITTREVTEEEARAKMPLHDPAPVSEAENADTFKAGGGMK